MGRICGIEVKCTTFSVEKMQEKYNRRKEKEEVRKLAEEYIDRQESDN